MTSQLHNRPWWAYIDTAILLALVAVFGKTVSWQGEVNQWRLESDARQAKFEQELARHTTQTITPGAAREIAVLQTRLTAAEAVQREMKNDIVARMDRQDRKLDALLEKIDRLAQ